MNDKNTGNNRKKGNNNRRRRRKPFNKNKNKNTGIDKAERSYLNLLEKHFQMRRKYFDLFHRADPKQLAKLERQFSNSAKELRDFEERMAPEVREKFGRKFHMANPDNTYSSNHELDPSHVEVDPTLSDDPHYLPSQKEANYSNDTEESEGSMEDYNKYKGL
ncbi:MAG: hypothetical protein GY909_16695 [Oligoflexia bacterium]|nr:hypothetical protein [Oligoflexia bacterium]